VPRSIFGNNMNDIDWTQTQLQNWYKCKIEFFYVQNYYWTSLSDTKQKTN
jgi:hypothetical protein